MTLFYQDPGRGSNKSKRLLLRLWLAHADSRELPHDFLSLYSDIAKGSYRGGVWPNFKSFQKYKAIITGEQ